MCCFCYGRNSTTQYYIDAVVVASQYAGADMQYETEAALSHIIESASVDSWYRETVTLHFMR